MSNVAKLAAAGLVQPDQLSDEHKDIIENHLSAEEVDALLSVQTKLGGVGSMHGPTTNVF